MRRRLTIERVYPHPRERVWRALTTSDAIAGWLMKNDFEPRVGHAFTLHTEPGPGFDGIVHCTVQELREPERMSWTWKGGPLDTVVTFALSDEGRSLVERRIQDLPSLLVAVVAAEQHTAS